MRERIIKSITIDTFIKYQNGNLVTDFNNENIKVDMNKYKNSKLNDYNDEIVKLIY